MAQGKVFVKSDAKDFLALSEASGKAIVANCTATITFAAAKTGDEAWDFIERLNIGHRGSVTTAPTHDRESGYARLCDLVKPSRGTRKIGK